MISTTEALQSAYAKRLYATSSCIFVCVFTARLVYARMLDGYLLVALLVICASAVGALTGAVFVYARWKNIRNLRRLQENGPYPRKEFVDPSQAGDLLRNAGDSDLWRVRK